MALQDYGSLPADASMASPAYRTAAFKYQQAGMQPARRQAVNELATEYGGRGLQGGGVALQGAMGARNDYLRKLAGMRQGLGVQQATLGEQNRQALEDRQNQLQDMAAEKALQDELGRWATDDFNTAQRVRPMQMLFGGLGQVGGTLAGNWASNKFANAPKTGASTNQLDPRAIAAQAAASAAAGRH